MNEQNSDQIRIFITLIKHCLKEQRKTNRNISRLLETENKLVLSKLFVRKELVLQCVLQSTTCEDHSDITVTSLEEKTNRNTNIHSIYV